MAAEHRFYGDSLPFGPNPTPEQLGYLVVDQAYVSSLLIPLSSLLHFISFLFYFIFYFIYIFCLFYDCSLEDYVMITLAVQQQYNATVLTKYNDEYIAN